MKKIKIICDSLLDLPKELIEENDICIIPLTVNFEGVEYIDGIDITKQQFYKMLRESKDLPKTSQVTYMTFKDTFEKYIAQGYSILYIGGSSNASGTYQSSVMARNDIEGNIYTYDSSLLSLGIGILALQAAKLARENKEIEEIVKELDKIKEKISVIFTVDTLEYLQKGGRVSMTKATIGNLLNIKPILNISNGTVAPKSQVRGKKQVIGKMIELLKEECKSNIENTEVIIGCGDNQEELEIVKEKVKELGISNIISVNIGSCICAHTGPGVIGMAYYSKN